MHAPCAAEGSSPYCLCVPVHSELTLANNNLTGTIPDVFNGLQQLMQLDVQGNAYLSGPVPDSLVAIPGVMSVIVTPLCAWRSLHFWCLF